MKVIAYRWRVGDSLHECTARSHTGMRAADGGGRHWSFQVRASTLSKYVALSLLSQDRSLQNVVWVGRGPLGGNRRLGRTASNRLHPSLFSVVNLVVTSVVILIIAPVFYLSAATGAIFRFPGFPSVHIRVPPPRLPVIQQSLTEDTCSCSKDPSGTASPSTDPATASRSRPSDSRSAGHRHPSRQR